MSVMRANGSGASVVKVGKGSRVKLKLSDGSYIEWQATSDVSLDHAVHTIERLALLDPKSADSEKGADRA